MNYEYRTDANRERSENVLNLLLEERRKDMSSKEMDQGLRDDRRYTHRSDRLVRPNSMDDYDNTNHNNVHRGGARRTHSMGFYSQSRDVVPKRASGRRISMGHYHEQNHDHYLQQTGQKRSGGVGSRSKMYDNRNYGSQDEGIDDHNNYRSHPRLPNSNQRMARRNSHIPTASYNSNERYSSDPRGFSYSKEINVHPYSSSAKKGAGSRQISNVSNQNLPVKESHRKTDPKRKKGNSLLKKLLSSVIGDNSASSQDGQNTRQRSQGHRRSNESNSSRESSQYSNSYPHRKSNEAYQTSKTMNHHRLSKHPNSSSSHINYRRQSTGDSSAEESNHAYSHPPSSRRQTNDPHPILRPSKYRLDKADDSRGSPKGKSSSDYNKNHSMPASNIQDGEPDLIIPLTEMRLSDSASADDHQKSTDYYSKSRNDHRAETTRTDSFANDTQHTRYHRTTSNYDNPISSSPDNNVRENNTRPAPARTCTIENGNQYTRYDRGIPNDKNPSNEQDNIRENNVRIDSAMNGTVANDSQQTSYDRRMSNDEKSNESDGVQMEQRPTLESNEHNTMSLDDATPSQRKLAVLSPWLEHCRDPETLRDRASARRTSIAQDNINISGYDPMKDVPIYEIEENLMNYPPPKRNSFTKNLAKKSQTGPSNLISAGDGMKEVCDQFTKFYKSKVAGDSEKKDKKQTNNLDTLEKFLSSSEKLPTCRPFPLDILQIIQLLPGNNKCCDCGTHSGFVWSSRDKVDESQGKLIFGSPIYGTLLCKDCAFRHITKGEEKLFKGTEVIISLRDGDWTLPDVLSMVEGGNQAVIDFYQKHETTGKKQRRSSMAAVPQRRGSLLQSIETPILATNNKRRSIQYSKTIEDDNFCSDFERVYGSKTMALYRKDLQDRRKWVLLKKVLKGN